VHLKGCGDLLSRARERPCGVIPGWDGELFGCLSRLNPAGYIILMIRPVLTELALFGAPFAVYAIYLWATRAGVLHPESWPLPRLMWLTIAALALMFGSFVILAQWGGEPSGSTYVPAHIENGKLIPGTTQ
jgi:hypothetical protein